MNLPSFFSDLPLVFISICCCANVVAFILIRFDLTASPFTCVIPLLAYAFLPCLPLSLTLFHLGRSRYFYDRSPHHIHTIITHDV